MDKEKSVLTRAKFLLAAESGATDEELWDMTEGFGENRKDELMSLVIASKMDHKIRFFSDFMSGKMPTESQSLLLKATQMSGNWETRAQYESLINRYEQEYGEDYDILIEKLNYNLKYDIKNTKRMSELMAKVYKLNGEAG